MDLPFALYEEFGGWNGEKIVDSFLAYAKTAFSLFGDRVSGGPNGPCPPPRNTLKILNTENAFSDMGPPPRSRSGPR